MRKPRPTSTPTSKIHRVLAVSSARTVAYAPATSRSTNSASGLLNRNISVATGVTASTTPAIRPAAGPYQRFTVAWSTPTAATPHSACGTSIAQLFSPKTRTDSAISHSDAGVLSTVIELAASDEP